MRRQPAPGIGHTRTHDEIPNARLVMFERNGHDPFVEEPDAFWRAVGRFLAATGLDATPQSPLEAFAAEAARHPVFLLQ